MGTVGRVRGRDGWWIVFKDGRGRRRRKKVPGTKADAERTLRDHEVKSYREREQLGGLTNEVPLDELAAAWGARVLAERRPRTWQGYTLALRQALAGLSATRGKRVVLASDVVLGDARAYAAAALAAGASARTVAIRIGALRIMLRWSVAQGLIGFNPLDGWRAPQGPKRKVRRALTELEIAKLLGASPEPFRTTWIVLVGTGLRAGELKALLWSDLDFETRTLTVRAETSKSNRTRTVPLRADVAAVLRRLRLDIPRRRAVAAGRMELAEALIGRAKGRQAREAAEKRLRDAQAAVGGAEERVFVNTGSGAWDDSLSRRLKPCLAAAGLPDSIDLHTLRHTFGSHLVAAGADVKTVQELLGHSSALVTLDCYAHAFMGRKREAVDLVPLPIMGGGGQPPSAPDARGARKVAGGLS